MKKAINRLLLAWQLGVVILFVGLTSYKLLTPPSVIEAQVASSTLGSIFSGRFIPAFIGQAYDPSEAYAAMTGLPVYVVAFQSWRGGAIGGNTTWVTGDLAIRTQIRADGTFQVMGLPEEAYYGVYFPYKRNLEMGKTDPNPSPLPGNFDYKPLRTDCVDMVAGGVAKRHLFDGQDPTTSTNVTTRNACKVTDRFRDIPFRMPMPEDKIQDVFSYAAFYEVSESNLGTPLMLDSQIESPLNQNPVTYERIALEHVFVTNRKDVDVDNNINTFPLVPTSAIRVNVNTTYEFAAVGTQVEVRAQRITVSGKMTPIDNSDPRFVVINSPVIRGRAIPVPATTAGTGTAIFTFQVYAPPGDYVVTVWRKEEGDVGYNPSPSYKEWDGKSDLNSRATGVGQLSVKLFYTPQEEEYHDWRGRLSPAYEPTGTKKSISLTRDALIMWGTVQNDKNQLLFKNSLGFDDPDIRQAYLKARQSLACDRSIAGEEIYGPIGGGSEFDDDDDYIILEKAPGFNTGRIYSNTSVTGGDGELTNSIKAVRGIYMVMARRGYGTDLIDTCAPNVPFSDTLWAYLNPEAFNSDPDKSLVMFNTPVNATSGFRSTIQGPVRSNLVVPLTSRADDAINGTGTVVKGGVDSGIFVRLTVPGSNDQAQGFKVFVDCVEASCPAEEGEYMTDIRGELHIPANDLVDKTAGRYEDRRIYVTGSSTSEKYTIPDRIINAGFGPGDWITLPGVAPDDANNNSLAYVCGDNTNCASPLNITLNSELPSPADKYNLAILNTIDRVINPVVSAADETFMDIEAIIEGYSDLEVVGEINAEITHGLAKGHWNGTPCTQDCKVFLPGENPAMGVWGTGGNRTTLNKDASFDGRFMVRVPAKTRNILKNGYVVTVRLVTKDTEGIGDDTISEDYALVTVDGRSGQLMTSNPITFDLNDNCRQFAVNQVRDEGGGIGGVKGGIKVWSVETMCNVGKGIGSKVSDLFATIQYYGLNTRPLTQDQVIVNLFNITRNVANLLFVVIFVLMAFMTVLRFQPEAWHTRVILPKLLLALVYSNFSITLVQLVMDVNNFATSSLFSFTANAIKAFVEAGGTGTLMAGGATAGAGLIGALGAAAAQMAMGIMSALAITGGSALFAVLLFVVCLIVVLVIQVGLLLVAFLMRYVIIWLAVVLAPFIFMLSVLPWFNNLRKQWLDYVLKVSVIQTEVAALLCIGILLLTVSSGADTVVTKFMQVLIFVAMMAMAVKIPKQAMSQLGVNLPEFTAETAKGIRGSLESGALKRRTNNYEFEKKLALETAADQAAIDAEQDPSKKRDLQLALEAKRGNLRTMNRIRSFRNSAAGFVADKAMGGLGSEYQEYYRKEVQEGTSDSKARTAGEARAVSLLTSDMIKEFKKAGKTNFSYPMGKSLNMLADRIKKTGGNTMVTGADGRPVQGLTFKELGETIERMSAQGKDVNGIRKSDFSDYKGLVTALNKIEQNEALRKDLQAELKVKLGGEIDLSGIMSNQAGAAAKNLGNATADAISKLQVK